jgi:cytidylate kinase
MSREKLVIAIDGPAGVGKSSVGKAVALKYGLSFLSTGEMYRCLGWKVLNAGIDPDDAQKVLEAAQSIKWSFERRPYSSLKVFVDGVYLAEVLLAGLWAEGTGEGCGWCFAGAGLAGFGFAGVGLE